MREQAKVDVVVKHRFSAPAELVFDAWLDPGHAGQWLFATPTGKMVRVEIDARVGGEFTLVDLRDGEEVAHVGRYLAIDRPRYLAFTFAVPKYSSEETTVAIDVVADDDGCDLTLTHRGVLAEYREQTIGGWQGILRGLEKTLG